ncbi:hypothetical protein [Calothrix sp. PCC 7507]|uniref:hypothetical protein n=1 Tax=Calothrix sp. PCC 7507 TaxID=99598 RepID=UPI00029EC459|nr:hypothetical protein [Calothrix sp. PCC 7507]AFY31624.1 hypothetical protein Cal7507_1150 [Calothrix sp. PCC 7507]
MEIETDYQALIFQGLGQKQLLAIIELVARQITEPDYYAHYVAEEMQHLPVRLPQIAYCYCDTLNEEIDKILFLQRLINVLANEAVTGKLRPKDFNDEYDP